METERGGAIRAAPVPDVAVIDQPDVAAVLDPIRARLLVLASRVLREVANLARRARTVDKPLATLAVDTDKPLATIADQADFTSDLTAAIADLAARYHDEQAPNGRWHRVITLARQRPPTDRKART